MSLSKGSRIKVTKGGSCQSHQRVGRIKVTKGGVVSKSPKGSQSLGQCCGCPGRRFSLSRGVLSKFAVCLYREMQPPPPRRETLPSPKQQEKSVSLWSILKECIGKDLSRVCLPVYFNEPLSVLQKTVEDLEYAELVNKVHTCLPAVFCCSTSFTAWLSLSTRSM